jgi:hypothetical protein
MRAGKVFLILLLLVACILEKLSLQVALFNAITAKSALQAENKPGESDPLVSTTLFPFPRKNKKRLRRRFQREYISLFRLLSKYREATPFPVSPYRPAPMGSSEAFRVNRIGVLLKTFSFT